MTGFGEVLLFSQVSEVEVELAREEVLGAGKSYMVATMVAMLVAVVAMLGLVPILGPETQTSGTAPALETLEYNPALTKFFQNHRITTNWYSTLYVDGT